ncbi:transcriptional regulator [archaeon SCG-AAA382B04]|nr:transcriptional regulator [archaeon SCG-AAA382B04]
MKQPCEIIVLNILPNLRAQLAKKLVEVGLTQQEVSETLDITPAAVSQYVSKKRGHRISFNSQIQKKIHQKAKEIKRDEKEKPINLICTLCEEIKNSDTFCKLLEREKEEQECEKCKYEPICEC